MSLPTHVHLDLRRAADVVDHALEVWPDYLTLADDRAHATAALAVDLLDSRTPFDRTALAYALAEACARLAERQVVDWPPAAGHIRLAHDMPGQGGEDGDRARRHADADLRGGR